MGATSTGDPVLLPVVIVHHRAPQWCADTVDAVLRSDGVAAAVIVVDNSGEILASGDDRSEVTIVDAGRNRGFAGGANLGLDTARHDHPEATAFLVCSHDAYPPEHAVRTLVSVLDVDPSVGIVGPTLVGGSSTTTGGRWRRGRAWQVRASPSDDVVEPRHWVSGSLLLIRAACLDEIGYFDPLFGSYVEDVDLCLRARDAGWGVVCATTVSVDTRGSASADRSTLAARNAILLVAKRQGRTVARLASLRYLGRGVRALVLGWIAVFRSKDRRRDSRRWGEANLDGFRAGWSGLTGRAGAVDGDE